jgi:hypothetical protein
MRKKRHGIVFTAAAKWRAMHWGLKTLISASITLAAISGGARAWVDLGLGVPATREWVQSAQYSLQEEIQNIQISIWNNRVSAIKDLLLHIELQKSKTETPAEEKAKLEFQFAELQHERADLEDRIKSVGATKK